MSSILIVFGALVAAAATYYFRGFNEIVIDDLPAGADTLEIVDYQGCGSLDFDSYPIVDGKVTMEWSYAIKTSHILYRVTGNGETLVEGDYSFGPCICHELDL